MLKTYIILLSLLVAFFSNAQRPATGQWYTANMYLNFSKHWQWHNDASYRTLGASFSPLQYLYRTGLRYNFNNKWNLAGGVAFFSGKTDFDKSHHEFGKEFRTWQEVIYMPPLNEKLQVQWRLRTEQRFFGATSIKQNYTAHRFRFRNRFTQKVSEKWSIQLADEYMQQLVHKKISFDQNRLMFSAIYFINKETQLQPGYMLLTWPDRSQHIFHLTFTKIISLHAD